MIEASLTNHNKTRDARISAERLVKIGVDTWTNGLQRKTHGFAAHRGEAFET